MSEVTIFEKLMPFIGNIYGVCGVMASMLKESNMKSNNLQNSANLKLGMTDEEYTKAVDSGSYTNFIFDRKGYGLCQWTSPGRKKGLIEFATSLKKSIGDEDMQVEYVKVELSKAYKSVLNKLKNAKTIKEASDAVTLGYEVPSSVLKGSPEAIKNATLKSRENAGIVYYQMFAEKQSELKASESKENNNMLTGKGLAEFAIGKIGMPYFYGAKIKNGPLTESYMKTMHDRYPNMVTENYMNKARSKGQVGKINVDCSGLIAGYRNVNIGSSQLYSTAKKRMPIANVNDFSIGTVLWKSGHVGVYIGKENGIPMCVEAKGINYGVVKTKVSSTAWTYGLTFSDMSYDYNTSLPGTTKGVNPYKEPTTTIKNGATGNDVKWLQWELVEAGYYVPFTYNGKSYKGVKIDGDFGPITNAALLSFQSSCKIDVDGKCGVITKKCLKDN